MDIRTYFLEKREIVDAALDRYFPKNVETPTNLQKAIRHSLFAGGKRIRPILAIAAFEAAGGKGNKVLPFACALEMVHTYSLIHDDLPAIDDDDYRRGKPTCHKVFGEGIALLAGDALLTEAFQVVTSRQAREALLDENGLVLDLINRLAQAAGMLGMVGGQVVDVESEGREVDLPTIQYIHTHKTGAMILASIQIGAKLAGAKEETFKALTRYGERVGLAFQIADDILNVEGTRELLGKNVGSDLSRQKATYPSVLGLEESKKRARELAELAVDALTLFGAEAEPLRGIAHFIIARDY